jgi:hypothetical protein
MRARSGLRSGVQIRIGGFYTSLVLKNGCRKFKDRDVIISVCSLNSMAGMISNSFYHKVL